MINEHLDPDTAEAYNRMENPMQKTKEHRDKILEELAGYWKKFPDLRLGQLIQNAVDNAETNTIYVEDTRLIEVLAYYEASLHKT